MGDGAHMGGQRFHGGDEGGVGLGHGVFGQRSQRVGQRIEAAVDRTGVQLLADEGPGGGAGAARATLPERQQPDGDSRHQQGGKRGRDPEQEPAAALRCGRAPPAGDQAGGADIGPHQGGGEAEAFLFKVADADVAGLRVKSSQVKPRPLVQSIFHRRFRKGDGPLVFRIAAMGNGDQDGFGALVFDPPIQLKVDPGVLGRAGTDEQDQMAALPHVCRDNFPDSLAGRGVFLADAPRNSEIVSVNADFQALAILGAN